MKVAYAYANQIDQITEKHIAALAIKNPALTCLETPGNKYYIGLWRSLTINAPLKEVASLLENFNTYSDIFESIENTKVIKKIDSANFLVAFEDKSPIFILPNIHYQMNYKIISTKNGKFFKYHLSDSLPQKNILASDGVIFLQDEGGATKFYELDFFNAQWGILENIAAEKIWPNAIRELIISDFELKIKAENPKITASEKKNKLKNLIDEKVIENCLNHKINAQLFNVP